jgi:hypothetical protein
MYAAIARALSPLRSELLVTMWDGTQPIAMRSETETPAKDEKPSRENRKVELD